jgi:hypothetical protein
MLTQIKKLKLQGLKAIFRKLQHRPLPGLHQMKENVLEKKVWAKISSEWSSFSGRHQYTEFLNDASYATAEELDEMLKVYRYDGLSAGIRCDAISGKDIIMNGNTYIYSSNLYLTGEIHKGTFSGDSWSEQKNLNYYFVMKGVKTLHCLDINNTTDLLELHYDDLDFELGPSPYYYLKLNIQFIAFILLNVCLLIQQQNN